MTIVSILNVGEVNTFEWELVEGFTTCIIVIKPTTRWYDR